MRKWIVEFLCKSHGRVIKISRVNSILAKSNNFIQYLTHHSPASDVFMDHRFLVQLAHTVFCLYILVVPENRPAVASGHVHHLTLADTDLRWHRDTCNIWHWLTLTCGGIGALPTFDTGLHWPALCHRGICNIWCWLTLTSCGIGTRATFDAGSH